jgi:(1->4)-alpha-D-glucan 1-alpha-D-glucosylmutase
VDRRALRSTIACFGLFNALSQVLLKLTSPGVPDIYQGQELWDFSLVDPDNRRPVDFGLRQHLLAEFRREVARHPQAGTRAARWELARQLAQNPSDPRLKLFVVWQALQFRRAHGDLFRTGRNLPLVVSGARAEHICAYAWQADGLASSGEQTVADAAAGTVPTAILVVPRFLARMARTLDDRSARESVPFAPAAWGDTRIELPSAAPHALVDLFTGRSFAAASGALIAGEVFSEFPVALLTP